MKPTDQFEDVTLYRGDCLDVLRAMPDASVDAIVTDPPYPEQFWPAFKGVIPHLARVLRTGGELIAVTGQHMLPHALDWLRATGLRYWWTCGMLHDSQCRMLGKNVTICWKPAVWFVKGTKRKLHDIPMDMIKGKQPKKTLHEWEQDPAWFRHWCDRICNPGETILDPFLGSGTTGLAAMQEDRKFVGIELDPAHYATALKRLLAATGGGEGQLFGMGG